MSPDGPLILALDTATRCCAVALTQGGVEHGTVLGGLALNSRITHSRRLLTAVDWLMAELGLSWPDLDGLAVGLGPGSFTGLRIGMATAKGLTAATDLPLCGVSTLDGLAQNSSGGQLICAVLDARKKEVYSGFYRRDERGVVSGLGPYRVLAPEQLAAEIQEPALFVGDGVLAYGPLWAKLLGNRFMPASSHLHDPPAAAIGLLAAGQLARGEKMDLATAVPLYVRASDAELSLGVKKGVL